MNNGEPENSGSPSFIASAVLLSPYKRFYIIIYRHNNIVNSVKLLTLLRLTYLFRYGKILEYSNFVAGGNYMNIPEIFAENVFNHEVMKARLPQKYIQVSFEYNQ